MTALVLLSDDRCPDCAQPTEHSSAGQPALFRHGGYGETRTSTVRWCPCGWTLLAAVTSSR